ncbi:MAG: VCBS repeat-containing protein [Chitinophagales bacterium]|nr:VCBS repeat-containing protein [Chitinophagales bacterium]HRX23959.1 VCBS repeat-containing protein [Chitinophagales bacterium]
MKNPIAKISLLSLSAGLMLISSCKLFSGGDSDTRGSVIIDKAREVTLDGNSGKRFDILTGKSTGIDFVNDLTENYEVNWWRYSYIYNGGGVCIGDVNKDGLPDLFFTGNLVPNKLYINKGNMQFEDVTAQSGIVKEEWEFSYGATMVDFDGDNDLDIYICNSRWDKPEKRKNRLWVNDGNMHFTEEAAKYGLDDDSYSSHADFFDYDNDGDLDMYLVTHPVDFIDKNKTKYFQKIEKGVNLSDKFYVNNGDGTYTEKHKEVGINNHGYGLSGTVGDLNSDGYLDIFVSNDYAMYDFIYINNGDGTFRDESLNAVKKTSINSMGSDVNDYNNDGYPDIIVADMDMEDNYTYKTFMLSSQVEVMRILINAGYGYQNRSNSLQLNNGDGTFGEISRTAGVATTDWSWSTLFADFDNDGWKDLFIANGFLRDFHVDESETYHKLRRAVRIEDSSVYYEVREKLPHYVLSHPNFIFRNNGDLTFTDSRDEWGIYYPSITYGAGYADLDGDGDLDIIGSNVNETPWIYRNNSEKFDKQNYINFQFEGYGANAMGLGTKVRVWVDGQQQFIQHSNVRGYITTMENDVHFGLGSHEKVDVVEVEWLDGAKQVLRDVTANQTITLSHKDAQKNIRFDDHGRTDQLFVNMTQDLGTDFKHTEDDYDDYLREYLLPHKMSSLAPGIAVADVNGDGRQDFYIGGAIGQSGAIYTQRPDGSFERSDFQTKQPDDLELEDAGALFFDADSDGDMDLYIATGGNEYPDMDKRYADRLYINDGKGNFTRNAEALPATYSSSSVITAADFDKDGDMDLFVGGRQVPGRYLASTSSYILQNNNGKFEDVSDKLAPALKEIGMVTSALWTDFNNDNEQDLIITGDWMPITFLQNKGGKFADVTAQTGMVNTSGWWQSIAAADFDNDGDMDYVVGNFGTNRRYRNTRSEADGRALPLEAFLADFDSNGKEDFIMAYYQHDQLYPVKTRERLIEQMPSIGDKFPTWDAFGKATVTEILGKEAIEKSVHKDAYIFHSSVLMNEGNGKFKMSYLPNEAQISVLFGMVVDDFNNDGYMDILAQGNFYNTEIEITRHDAGTGILLLNNGKGKFSPERSISSGFRNDGDAKGMATILVGAKNQPVYLLGNSDGNMLSYGLTSVVKTIPLNESDAFAMVTLKNGEVRRQELQAGSGYLSQSAKFIRVSDLVSSVEVTSYNGQTRTVYPGQTASK